MMFSRDHLVAALHQRGICYLAPSPHGDEPALSDDELLIGLATSKDGRLRFALAGLLLVHPDLAENLAALVETRIYKPGGPMTPELSVLPGAALVALQPTIAEDLKKQYLAAMYLQRLWRTQLRLRFGESPLIPDRFTHEMNAPGADTMYGEMGLRALTEGSMFNDWSSYQQVVDMICEQPCAALPLGETSPWEQDLGSD